MIIINQTKKNTTRIKMGMMNSYEPQISKPIFDAQCFAARVLRPEHRGLRQGPWNPWYSDTGIEPSDLPFGKHTNNYGESPFLVCKSTISMAIFNTIG